VFFSWNRAYWLMAGVNMMTDISFIDKLCIIIVLHLNIKLFLPIIQPEHPRLFKLCVLQFLITFIYSILGSSSNIYLLQYLKCSNILFDETYETLVCYSGILLGNITIWFITQSWDLVFQRY